MSTMITGTIEKLSRLRNRGGNPCYAVTIRDDFGQSRVVETETNSSFAFQIDGIDWLGGGLKQLPAPRLEFHLTAKGKLSFARHIESPQ